MIIELTLPRQSEKNDESLVTFWHVSEGDKVDQGDPLVEVQTEKAVTEIEATETGIVKEIKKKRADTVAVGEVLVLIDTEMTTDKEEKSETHFIETTNTQTAPAENIEKVATPRIKKLASELGVDWKHAIPSGRNGKIAEEDIKKLVANVKEEKHVESKHDGSQQVETNKQSQRRFIAAPSVRKFARENQVNLEEITLSDPNGKIVKRDIEEFIAKRNAKQAVPTVSSEVAQDESTLAEDQRIPLSGIRQAIAKAMVHSKSTIPQVTHFDEANVAKLVGQRESIKPHFAEKGVKLTYLAYVVKALTLTLQKFPYLNASFDDDNEEIIVRSNYHIGFAADTERGLIVPVIKHANKKSLYQIASEIQNLAKKAKEGTISPDDMSDATCTISNVGSANGSWFTPIINAPQSSILGIGRIEKKAVVVDDSVEIQPLMALSLTYDHRLIDGVLAQNTLNELKKYLSEPELLLALV